ncbi:lipase [Gregarina niphandrodes]|uniref:Lipase n=1 Tax=Gregarina niphandrodes TaxID=110365 RepID=A0A023BCP5_GRENI|nr:lipase [Gregarina niphandrodes]EZG83566.1 lipase [Gregarina niphandrodes]|eukprot:XP_011128927.1 lipase [Gregarina niphandrodes]
MSLSYVEDLNTLEPIAINDADPKLVIKAQERADKIGKMGVRYIGPVAPKFADAYSTVRPLLVRLSMMTTRSAYRSFKLLSQLQRVVQDPYLPSDVSSLPLVPADDADRVALFRTCALLSSAVYSLKSVQTHNLKSVNSAGRSEQKKLGNIKYRLTKVVSGMEILLTNENEGVCQPVFAVCSDGKAYFIVVRGSSAVEDFATNLMCDPLDGDLGPHRGMALSADWLDKRIRKHLLAFIEKHPKAKIILTGHSLGAGSAALLTIKWLKELPQFAARIQCVAIACPAILNEHDSYVSTDRIKTIIFGKDIVPRLSFGSFRDLLVQMKALADLEVEGSGAVSSAGSAIINMAGDGVVVVETGTPDYDAVSDTSTAASSSRKGKKPMGRKTPGRLLKKLAEDSSSEDEEWKKLPERLDQLESYESIRNVILTDVNFSGLSEAERLQQNKALAAQLARAKVTFGGASFNQIHTILKKRVKQLDARRKKLLKNPSGKPSWWKRLGWKILKFWYGGCRPTTKKISATTEQQNQLLDLCMKEIKQLRCSSSLRFLVPPGEIFLCVPRIQFVEQERDLPKIKKVLKGQCYMFKLDRHTFNQQALQPIWSISAFRQHSMSCYLQALAPDTLSKCPLDMILEESGADDKK